MSNCRISDEELEYDLNHREECRHCTGPIELTFDNDFGVSGFCEDCSNQAIIIEGGFLDIEDKLYKI